MPPEIDPAATMRLRQWRGPTLSPGSSAIAVVVRAAAALAMTTGSVRGRRCGEGHRYRYQATMAPLALCCYCSPQPQ